MAGRKSSKSSNKKEDIMPDTLLGFGYEFVDGKLQQVKTGKPFEFVVREGDHSYNQKRYEALGEIITEEVYTLLETECSLKKFPVPFDAKDEEPATFIFKSEDAFINPDKLMVFIHGSGVVRAGQWARRLVINESIESGTQIPFIQEAQKEGYGILVMNTNDNSRKIKGKTVKIRGSEHPEQHAAHVWENYIKKAEAKHIALIAHSYGGCVTTALFQKEKQDFVKRVFAVAMTDSVHYISPPRAFRDLIRISRNWVSSQTPLDTPLSGSPGDIKRISAGVDVHEQTSWCSFRSIFKFLQKRYDIVTKGKEDADSEEGGDEGSLFRTMSIGSTTGEGGVEESIPEEEDDGGEVAMKGVASGDGEDVTIKGASGDGEVTKKEASGDGDVTVKGASSAAHDMSDSDSADENKKQKMDK